jgi:hypothetical protein
MIFLSGVKNLSSYVKMTFPSLVEEPLILGEDDFSSLSEESFIRGEDDFSSPSEELPS